MPVIVAAVRAGAGSGAAGVLAVLPLDVVRVRQQVDLSSSRRMFRQALAMVQLEGPATLLRGATYPLATITAQVCPVLPEQPASQKGLTVTAIQSLLSNIWD